MLSVLAGIWAANSAGLLSSNDGSHVALARALILRGETSIDPDRALTLEIDLAERAGRAYSDRPPGTAFVALVAVWIGDRFDERLFERAMDQAKAGEPVDPLPGALPYISTYAARQAEGSKGPPLAKLIATGIAASIHAICIGLLGLLLVDRLIVRALGTDATRGARIFALVSVGLATLWGPYSTTLFSHVSAATGVAGFLLGIVSLHGDSIREPRWVAALTGLAGAWAIACDYLLILAVLPTVALTIDWRRFGAVAVGTLPIVAATLGYHLVAFASPFAIGYDHQHEFEFARTRASTFSGDLLDGAWTLFGLGRDAGLLAQAPLALFGVGAVVAFALVRRHDKTNSTEARRKIERALLGFGVWMIALTLHRTPWGGGTQDHRYLIPMLPFVGLGLALAWARAPHWLIRGALVGLAVASVALVWRPFLAWHEATPFARPGLGLLVAAPLVFAAAAMFLRERSTPPENLRRT